MLEECINDLAGRAAKVGKLAEERGVTASQLSLAWVTSQGEDVVAIPGTTKVKNLESNVAQQVALSAEEAATVAAAVPHETMQGARYTAGDAATFKGN
eukprot:COSAG04_NODE_7330_length_1146_cov_1.297994_2_plen_98_part_00